MMDLILVYVPQRKVERQADIIQNSSVENSSPKTEGTKTKATRTAEIETGMAEKFSWELGTRHTVQTAKTCFGLEK
jgi:hypothetical protein